MSGELLQKKHRFFPTTALLILLYSSLLLAVCYFSEKLGVHFTICILKNITGIPCPFCGGTRAAWALMHGNMYDAFLLNPLATVLLLSSIPGYIVYRYCTQVRGWRVRLPWYVWLFIAGIVGANWVYLIRVGR